MNTRAVVNAPTNERPCFTLSVVGSKIGVPGRFLATRLSSTGSTIQKMTQASIENHTYTLPLVAVTFHIPPQLLPTNIRRIKYPNGANLPALHTNMLVNSLTGLILSTRARRRSLQLRNFTPDRI